MDSVLDLSGNTFANIFRSGLEVVVCVALKVLVFEDRDLRKESYCMNCKQFLY